MGKRPRKNPRFNLQEVDGENLLYDTATHNVVYLDATGSLVFQLCDGARDVAAITSLLVDAYPADAGRIPGDVVRTIDALVTQGPLEWPSVEETALSVLAKAAKIDRAALTPETPLASLGLASIDVLEIVFELEGALDIEVPDGAIEDLREVTVADLVRTLSAVVEGTWKRAASS